jgi:hypothetical protein
LCHRERNFTKNTRALIDGTDPHAVHRTRHAAGQRPAEAPERAPPRLPGGDGQPGDGTTCPVEAVIAAGVLAGVRVGSLRAIAPAVRVTVLLKP